MKKTPATSKQPKTGRASQTDRKKRKTTAAKRAVGCLLVHGFTGSPNELLDLAAFLRAHGLRVSLPVLPGHATYSGDLFNYTWRDWFACVKREYEALSEQCSRVVVCGLSMGGTLALHLAAHKPVAGVIALAAPVTFPAWQRITVKLLKNILKFRKKRGGEDIRDLAQKPKLGSYRRYPYYAVDQLLELAAHVLQDLPEVEAPLLVMHSPQDHTIPFHNSEVVFNAVSSVSKNKIDLSESFHIITADVERERVQEEVLAFIRSDRSKDLLSPGPRKSRG